MYILNTRATPGYCQLVSYNFVPFLLGGGRFRAGQFLTDEASGEVSFVRGQVVHTKAGAKFVEGETVQTEDGIKFVAG